MSSSSKKREPAQVINNEWLAVIAFARITLHVDDNKQSRAEESERCVHGPESLWSVGHTHAHT
jgi:hypothetical protein